MKALPMVPGGGDRPRVTVLLPVHNGGAYLDAAVRSILGQTFPDFELLAIDDGSTDGSGEVLRGYRDPRLRLLENGRNLGLVKTLNRGLTLSRGAYIARMDCDDVSLPERFARQLRFLDTHPDIGVLGTCGERINEDGKTVAPFCQPLRHEAIRFCLHFFCPLTHPSVMMRKGVVLGAGGYLPGGPPLVGERVPEDYDLWWRLSTTTRFANLPDCLLLLRKHAGTVTARYMDEFRFQAARINRERIEMRLGEGVREEVAEAMMSQRYEPPDLAREVFRTIIRLYRSFVEEGLPAEAAKEIRQEVCEQLARVALYRGNVFRIRGLLGEMSRLDPNFRHTRSHLLRRVEAKMFKKPMPH